MDNGILTPPTLSSAQIRGYAYRGLKFANDSPGFRRCVSWGVFCLGLAVWIAVQGAMINVPLWTRALPPEPDDSVSYILKTREMAECPKQNCPALQDLREQLTAPGQTKETLALRSLAGSRIFPQYHPLFSALLLNVQKFGVDVETAYKIVWSVSPVFFGLAFAYLLVTLFGPTVAGGTLFLLAFKVFPETGLGRVVPSNIAMAIAVALWARIIARRGDAPWSIVIVTVALVSMHPIGRIYAVMAAAVAVCMPGFSLRLRRVLPLVFVGVFVGLAFANVGWLQITGVPAISVFLESTWKIRTMLTGAGESLLAVMVEIVRMKDGMFGSIPIFCGALALGLFVLPSESRRVCIRFLLIYLCFMGAVLLYRSSHPGDVIFRMCIPFVVTLIGVVGYATYDAFVRSLAILLDRLKETGVTEGIRVERIWPVVCLAILLGYGFQMGLKGSEHVMAATKHLTDRQPLRIDPAQTELLLSEAKPGDRVLYTSMIIMPYYFTYGSMSLGAVYYQPAMAGDKTSEEWLRRKDLRFAVTYNPTVYHPSFEGVDENRWWVQKPEYIWSPLSSRRKHPPISVEGVIPASRFRWIEVVPKIKDYPLKLSLRLTNPGKQSSVSVMPLNECGIPLMNSRIREVVHAKWSGWVELELPNDSKAHSYRIVLPAGEPKFAVSAIVFGDDARHWPWAQKADVMFMPRKDCSGPITVSFDPAKLLPPPVNRNEISVLNDEGSSVLFGIRQPTNNIQSLSPTNPS
jgi:hypothetical protein